ERRSGGGAQPGRLVRAASGALRRWLREELPGRGPGIAGADRRIVRHDRARRAPGRARPRRRRTPPAARPQQLGGGRVARGDGSRARSSGQGARPPGARAPGGRRSSDRRRRRLRPGRRLPSPSRSRDPARPSRNRADDFDRSAGAELGQDAGVTAKQAVVLQHTPTEGPERVAVLLAERGVGCAVRALYRGAQLLAAAGGARVYPNTRPGPRGPEPAREVGWGPVDLIGAEREPVLAGLGPRAMVLHWHGDTFDLPPGATHLASTLLCPHQAFRLGRRQFGLQFHCELEAASIAAWVREDAEFVRAANGEGGAARILADTARLYAEARPGWDRLLGNAIDLLRA